MEVLAVYTGIAFCWLFFSTILFCCVEVPEDKRTMARGMFLSPVWPVVLARLASRQVAKLWRTADWKNL